MPDGRSVETHGMAAHLRDAIRLNRARRPGYVRLGGWRAGLASSLLIAAERALLPFAHALDRAARPFVEAGVPILVADLMPMADTLRDGVSLRSGTGAKEATPRRSAHRFPQRADRLSPLPGGTVRVPESDGAAGALGRRTGGLARNLRLGAVRRALRGGAFPEAADALADALRVVQDAEADTGRAYALTAHVLESAGLMALRAPRYAEASGGATIPLSRRLVAGHLPLVWAALQLDRIAHPVQARGVPLFVGDLPPVPFEAEHAR